jgi:L-threonylcarbamoyladenylate synthase
VTPVAPPVDPLVQAAAAALRRGELVAFPTETVYGLGADARSPAAVAKVFAAKGRPATHPLIVHVRDLQAARPLARAWPEAALRLAARFWPGPLTLVLRRGNGVPPAVTGGQDTVALRVPAHPVAQALLTAFDGPIAAPSANRYGHVSPTCAAHVRAEFGAAVPIVLDGGDCAIGLESTIVACDEHGVTLLRPGHIGRAALAAVAGPIGAPAEDAPRVPGSLRSHYAPATPTRLIERTALRGEVAAAARAGRRVALLCRGDAAVPGEAVALCVCAACGAVEYAHDLYANLRRLDAVAADEILVETVPLAVEWEAVRDRLVRAAAQDGGHDSP